MNDRGLEYAVVGGIALAFHDQPRFTRDIDILAKPVDLSHYQEAFMKLGYSSSAEPWKFDNTDLTLHRFAKPSEEDPEDLIIIDLLIGKEDRHAEIIRNSLRDDSPSGSVRLANRSDLIWMKKQRGSKQDEADIENLEQTDDQN